MDSRSSNGEKNENTFCHSCNLIIDDEECVQALAYKFHQKCFVCVDCKQALGSWYFEKAGLLYCRQHYIGRFHDSCNHCYQRISGLVMGVGEHRYHPECFRCVVCESFIGEGETFSLVERSKLYCGQCYSKISMTHSMTTATSVMTHQQQLYIGHRPHSIQLIEMSPFCAGRLTVSLARDRTPPTTSPRGWVRRTPPPSTTTPSPLSSDLPAVTNTPYLRVISVSKCSNGDSDDAETCLKEDDNASIESVLQVGDRIIEVNGSSVVDQSVEEIGSLLHSHRKQSILLAVERGASPISLAPPYNSIQAHPNNYSRDINSTPANNLQSADLKHSKIDDNVDDRRRLLRRPNNRHHNRHRYHHHQTSDDDNGEANNAATPLGPRKSGATDDIDERDEKQEEVAQSTSDHWSYGLLRTGGKMERSTSMPKGAAIGRPISVTSGAYRASLADLGRTQSLRTPSGNHRVFRASDLVPGEVLGRGFFGQATKMTHKITGEEMVMKELYSFDKDAQDSFLKELSVLRSLDHPNVLRFVGVLYRYRKLNLITEFIPGGTLKNLIQDMTKLFPWKQRVACAKDISAGMMYLHSRDIIHRDLNSNNCLVRRDGSVVVADFGLARVLFESASPVSIFSGDGGGNTVYRNLPGSRLPPSPLEPIPAGQPIKTPSSLSVNHASPGGALSNQGSVFSSPSHTPPRPSSNGCRESGSVGHDIGSAGQESESVGQAYGSVGQESGSVHHDCGSASQDTGSANQDTGSASHRLQMREKRKKRYTVVGSPYWMAPEMMKGEKYDEKVDVFSFGIVMCEIIGRVQADPDYLPRTIEFGLNVDAFKRKLNSDYPEPFLSLAVMCCRMNAETRPSFDTIYPWLEAFLIHLDVLSLPSNCSPPITDVTRPPPTPLQKIFLDPPRVTSCSSDEYPLTPPPLPLSSPPPPTSLPRFSSLFSDIDITDLQESVNDSTNTIK